MGKEEKEYYRFEDLNVIRDDGKIIEDVLSELNDREHLLRYHKKQRAIYQADNNLLWDLFHGIIAYIRLKYKYE